ncbi:conserved hypothetical protein [Desulfonatronospira thiodismutans ASO3-1]|uniref:DUF4258 domain-containing protein n=1 Tax=Desulfonatronospira thiodismutans ASO3-1 TaxID=555779 RepID=D6SSA3_9BACT|nr:conserved hypothetical protein [Desulfonatronospira thiodismutans ASO3-1]
MDSLTTFHLCDHARQEMQRRGIEYEVVVEVLANPEQVLTINSRRKVYQSRMVTEHTNRQYLYRIFVDFDRNPPVIVTAYRTGKITKYWRQQHENNL